MNKITKERVTVAASIANQSINYPPPPTSPPPAPSSSSFIYEDVHSSSSSSIIKKIYSKAGEVLSDLTLTFEEAFNQWLPLVRNHPLLQDYQYNQIIQELRKGKIESANFRAWNRKYVLSQVQHLLLLNFPI